MAEGEIAPTFMSRCSEMSINIWFYLFNENNNIIVTQKCQHIKMDKIYPSKGM